MKVKNKRPCLITINHGGANYALMPVGCPGDTQTVPDEAYGLHFVQAMLNAGQIEISIEESKKAPVKADETPEESAGDEKGDLIAQLAEKGIVADRRWSVKKLQDMLANANN